MSCPYAVSVPGVKSMKGCSLTESKKEIIAYKPKKHYQLCPSSCYDGDFTKCPNYRNRPKTNP